ncbi:MAG: DUF6178 family protein [Desulfobacterales bacterium]
MADRPPSPSPESAAAPGERLKELARRRAEILSLPAEQALERILAAPQPAALVHAIPETDFHLLVQDIGPEDALPLLKLASNRQWDHLLDVEVWAGDRLEVHRATRWMDLLLEADPPRFVRWFLGERLTFGELYLFHNLEVRVREHDQDPSEFGEGFFTLDQVYYVRILDLPRVAGGSGIDEDRRRRFLTRLLERIAAEDHLVFQSVLLEAAHVIPAETEEEEYRWRNVRLAEKGFVPFDEAVGIYQPLTAGQLARSRPKRYPRATAEEGEGLLPVPALPLRELPEATPLRRALARIEPGERLLFLQWEFANLCNRIIAADRRAVKSREDLREVVAKACGYLGIALETLEGGGEAAADPARSAALLLRHPLVDLFRLGFGEALRLKWQTEKWLAASWFARQGLKLSFWGERWMGVLGGILLKKPLFYDNYRTGLLYREFASRDDIAATAKTLDRIREVDRLLGRLAPRLDPAGGYRFLTWKNLLLTEWAATRLGLPREPLTPLPLSAFRPFFAALFAPGPGAAPESPRRIPAARRSDFVSFLAAETGIGEEEIRDAAGAVFEELFAELEAEYGRVAPQNLDPRFVLLFLLRAG